MHGSAAGVGYDAKPAVTWSLRDVPVNIYGVQITVYGGSYEGHAQHVLVVCDTSLGFTTGGWWITQS